MLPKEDGTLLITNLLSFTNDVWPLQDFRGSFRCPKKQIQGKLLFYCSKVAILLPCALMKAEDDKLTQSPRASCKGRYCLLRQL